MNRNNEIRKELLIKRWNLSDQTKNKFDEIIFNKVIFNLSKKIKSKYIGLYWPMENEVDTTRIIKWLLNNGFNVCLPRIHKNVMNFISIQSLDFESEFWHCMKQPKSTQYVDPEQIQLLIVPLIGFNKNRYRLGYGMNFYNNFLKNYPIRTIGIAYSFQFNNEIMITNKDIKLDKIITEE